MGTDTVHIVGKDETLPYIARKYNTTVDRLLELNPQISDPYLIWVGLEIRIG